MNFEQLVNYATNGSMPESKVCEIIEKLKKEKLVLMQKLMKMPFGKERRDGFRNLHKAMMQLYGAVSYTLKEDGEKVYKPVPALANMIMCYDGH